MATKKSFRKIVVDGLEYRWRMRRPKFDDYGAGAYYGYLTYVVWLTSAKNGTGLTVTTALVHPKSWEHEVYEQTAPIAVTPSDVTRCVRAALQLGWLPSQPGKPFEYEDKTVRQD
jgi:hypothetical protein